MAGILASFGYDPQLPVQSDGAIHGIQLSVSVLPTITFMVAIGCLFFYEINKKMESHIEQELLNRRENNAG